MFPSVSALIVVFGDLGRSPRMLNHARALRGRGWSVTLAGYNETELPPDLVSAAGTSRKDDSNLDPPAVRVVDLLTAGAARPSSISLSTALLRLLTELQRQTWTAVIVQNPPGFPALAICALATPPGAAIVLDWHNLGGTLLALRPSSRRRWAPLYSWCEAQAARFADFHWAVSAVLSRTLKPRTVTVVYDRPAKAFCAAAAEAAPSAEGENRLTWWRRVLPDRPMPEGKFWIAAPSSWGPDEDHGAMLRAAECWKVNYQRWGDAPQITIIATGKGPGQAEFARAASAFDGGPVTLQTAWIPAKEYPAFLAHADAGLCLHRSSSGLDLPMKLADFRGARLPALVLDYGPVLAETFQAGPDGWTFRNDKELAQALRPVAQSYGGSEAIRWSATSGRAGPDRVLAAVTSSSSAELAEHTTWEDEWERQLGAWAENLEARAACI